MATVNTTQRKADNMFARIALACVVTLLFTGCSKPETTGTTTTTSTTPTATTASAGPSPAVAAQDLYKTRCVPCHGETGKGDGPGAAALTPKPRNYTDATWQKSVKDEDIKKTILYGGAAVGKSPLMPGNPDLDSPDKQAQLDALVAIVRGFSK